MSALEDLVSYLNSQRVRVRSGIAEIAGLFGGEGQNLSTQEGLHLATSENMTKKLGSVLPPHIAAALTDSAGLANEGLSAALQGIIGNPMVSETGFDFKDVAQNRRGEDRGIAALKAGGTNPLLKAAQGATGLDIADHLVRLTSSSDERRKLINKIQKLGPMERIAAALATSRAKTAKWGEVLERDGYGDAEVMMAGQPSGAVMQAVLKNAPGILKKIYGDNPVDIMKRMVAMGVARQQFGDKRHDPYPAVAEGAGGGRSGSGGASGSLDVAPPALVQEDPAQTKTEQMDAIADGAEEALESDDVSYSVLPGDSLWSIAKKMYGDPRRYIELAAINGIKDPNMIQPGQKLVIPK